MIYGDLKVAQECFATVKAVERVKEDSKEHNKTPKLEFEGEFEPFILDLEKPEQTLKISKHLPISLRMQINEILVQYKDIFAWSSS